MRTFLILLSAAILIVFVQAQLKSKPVVNLAKRPRPVWNRPPEERRKLSIFPKTNKKFVVTPKTVKDDDEVKEGLPTKRPLMRKFVMRDKNEIGTWSFVPREPLMKTQRFTVTLAPQKSNYHETNDEIRPEESKRVQSVISNMTTKLESNKTHNVNKGNLIEMLNIKKDLSESKILHKLERNITGEEILQTAKVNDTQNQTVPTNSNKPLSTFGVDLIDVRSFNDGGVTLDSKETISKDQKEYASVNKTTDTLSTKVVKDFVENRAVDLNEMIYPIDQSENNSLVLDSEGANNHKIEQTLNFNDLEILFEKIVNNTEQSNIGIVSGLKDSDVLIKVKNETNITVADIPQFDVSKPNEFYDIISLGTDEHERIKLMDDFPDASIIQESHNMQNDKLHPVSETNALNDKEDFTEQVANTLIVGNLESLINFIENDRKNHENIDEPRENIGNRQKTKTNKDNTTKHTTASPIDGKITNYFTNDSEDIFQTQSSKQHNNDDANNSNLQGLSLEIYESDMPLSNEEISSECDECDLSLDEIYYKPISNVSSYDAEEHSNAPLINNKSNEEFSSESSLNVTSEEKSNESYPDKYNNLTEEISNESIVESSNSFTSEQLSNESSLNIGGEELSNESSQDKSHNLTEEISSESIVESSNSFSGEQFLNESSSNVAGDEFLTEEMSSDSGIESSNNFTDEQISNESLNISDEETSNESYLTHDISEESMESSYNFTGEATSNDSSSNMAGEEISNESHVMDNVSEESIETFNNFTGEEIPMELIIDNSDSVTDERIPDEFAGIAQDPRTEEIAEEALTNRFKRNNNVIEEESLPTTISGFKYSGQKDRLNHDFSYKNINA